MNNLVVLSYGKESEYRRAVLAILSYYSWLASSEEVNRTIIFTDNPAYFEPYLFGLKVEYISLTKEKIRDMKGPANFIHRMKIAVLSEVFRAYPTDTIFYIDSDTFIQADPAPLLARISPAVSVMHVLEYALEGYRHEDTGGRLVQLIENQVFVTTKGDERFSPSHFSWNAGVLGLAPSMAAYLPDVFLLTDKFFAASTWHISEQLAFSLVLQTRTQIIPSDEVVYHYWQNTAKLAVDAILSGVFTQEFATLPLLEKKKVLCPLTRSLPDQIPSYLQKHPEIELRFLAIGAFHRKEFLTGYKLASSYLIKKPTDISFLKDVIYHTRKQYWPKAK